MHQEPKSEIKQGVARRGGGNGKERCGSRRWGVLFVAIASMKMGMGVAKLGRNHQKKIISLVM